MGKIDGITRPEFAYEMIGLMRTHSITLNQTFILYCKLYDIKYEFPDAELYAADLMALFNKGLLRSGQKVNRTKMFGKKKSAQLTLDINFTTDPICTDETLKLAKNLEAQFVPEWRLTDENIKAEADTSFRGDLGIARYFMTFRALFPTAQNENWNTHFGFGYIGTNRWDTSTMIEKKFKDVYKTRDIGLFLAGTYYYILDSIESVKGECYCSKPGPYLDSYRQWYELAKTKLENQAKSKPDPTKTL